MAVKHPQRVQRVPSQLWPPGVAQLLELDLPSPPGVSYINTYPAIQYTTVLQTSVRDLTPAPAPFAPGLWLCSCTQLLCAVTYYI